MHQVQIIADPERARPQEGWSQTQRDGGQQTPRGVINRPQAGWSTDPKRWWLQAQRDGDHRPQDSRGVITDPKRWWSTDPKRGWSAEVWKMQQTNCGSSLKNWSKKQKRGVQIKKNRETCGNDKTWFRDSQWSIVKAKLNQQGSKQANPTWPSDSPHQSLFLRNE